MMENKSSAYFVYIYGDAPRSTVEIGLAGNLQQHTQKKAVNISDARLPDQKLVYYEYFRKQEVAVARERQLKENTKAATFHLIESMNPNWLDLSDML